MDSRALNTVWRSIRSLSGAPGDCLGELVPQFSEWEAQQGGITADSAPHNTTATSADAAPTTHCSRVGTAVQALCQGPLLAENKREASTDAGLKRASAALVTKPATAPAVALETEDAEGVGSKASTTLWTQLDAIRQAWRRGDAAELSRITAVDRGLLEQLAWSGVPGAQRALAWKLLLDYCPPQPSRLLRSVSRKRDQYWQAVAELGLVTDPRLGNRLSSEDWARKRQIDLDVPRTAPEFPLFHTGAVQQAMTRILHLWSVRHPAAGYVQGLNDILVPLLYVFYADQAPEFSQLDRTTLPEDAEPLLREVEADTYWCLSTLLEALQDQYVFGQPGIQRRVALLERIMQRIDASLCAHLAKEQVTFMQFAFRWMNCLLVREFPLPITLRLWDAYLSERGTFAAFHVYVCAALLERFSLDLVRLTFPDLVLFLQNLPTRSWTEQDLSTLLSRAYMFKAIFEDARRL
jgi:hypothetical protein